MSFSIKILGSNSAIPAYGRNHSSQHLTVHNQHYLIDCGEGTQLQLLKCKLKISKINYIFISHLHGDHYLGLQGLLSSMHLLGRTKILELFGPPGTAEIITLQLKYSKTILNYHINFHEILYDSFCQIHEDKLLKVYSIPLKHKIDCAGFLFREKPKPRRIIKEKLPDDLTVKEIVNLKKGMDITDTNGKVKYKNSDLTKEPRPMRSYAYCTDTKYDEGIIPHIKGVDILYHETTFLHENENWAQTTFHSTSKQAGKIATKAEVGKLLIGHFSARYKDLDPFLVEARQEFKNTYLALEGQTFAIDD